MARRSPFIGKYLGNYRVTAEIDCGSFGCVYRAQHAYLPRVAAVKLLHTAHLHSPDAYNQFLREARLLERLKHPHILPIYEFGIDDDVPYLVTEYASGGSLRDLLLHRFPSPLPVGEAISIITQVGDALYFAHQRGVIHHDLKPENILFNGRGDAVLADFGIAIVHATATLKGVIEVNGTPSYMAPEQFRGEVSRRSDQYSLGCIAYELLTGRQPFSAPDVISMGLKHMREPPIPPTRANPTIPQEIEYVILKALEKRRINRYPDVLSFIEALVAPHAAQMHPSSMGRVNAVTLVSKTKEQLLNEGTHLYQLGLYEEALEAYELTIHLDSHFAEAHFGKGNALYFLGRYAEALRAFDQAILLAPFHAAFHNNKGGVLYILGRNKEALMAYEEALRLDSQLTSARRGRSMTLRRLGRSR